MIEGMKTALRRTNLGLAGVGVLGLVALGVRLDRVHQDTWQWRLSPSQNPPKIRVFQRDYRRSDASSRVLPRAKALGHAPGGGQLWGMTPAPYVPTAVWIRTRDGDTTYVLMGGP